MRANVLAGLLWWGTLHTNVDLQGRSVDVVVDLDVEELDRRGGAVCPDRDALWAFSLLPEELPVPASAVDPCIRAALGGVSACWISYPSGFIVRHYRPPLRIAGITAARKRWQDSVHAVGIFAADAPRAIVVSEVPQSRSGIWQATRELGIGLVVDDGQRTEILHPPDRHLVRPGFELWSLAEEIYSVISTTLTTTGEPRRAVRQAL